MDRVRRVPPLEQLYAQLHARRTPQVDDRPITPEASHPVKVMGVTIISRLEIWKVWVVSHHLSAKHCTKIALAEVLGSEWMMGLKPGARIWPLASLVKT